MSQISNYYHNNTTRRHVSSSFSLTQSALNFSNRSRLNIEYSSIISTGTFLNLSWSDSFLRSTKIETPHQPVFKIMNVPLGIVLRNWTMTSSSYHQTVFWKIHPLQHLDNQGTDHQLFSFETKALSFASRTWRYSAKTCHFIHTWKHT